MACDDGARPAVLTMNVNAPRLWLSIMLIAAMPHVYAAEDMRIVPLVRGNELLISIELPEAYSAEIQQSILSGLQTTFTYDVELRLAVPFWADRTVASAVVNSTDRYDSLSGRHNLVRTVDGRVVEAVVARDEEVVRVWLTTQSRLALFDTSRLEPNREYYVRVRAQGRPQTGSLLARVTAAITGQVPFTFIP